MLFRSRIVALLGFAIAAVIAVRQVGVAWRSRIPFDAPADSVNRGMTDFRDTAILPNKAIAAGVNPYDAGTYTAFVPFAQEFDAYAPWWLTATYPLSLLDWDVSTLVWAIISVLCYLAAGVYLSVLIRRTPWVTQQVAPLTAAAACVLLTLLWRATAISLGLGNVGAIVALASGMALISPNRWVGWVLMAIAWIKPQFGIPVTIALLCLPGKSRLALGGFGLAFVASIPATVTTSQLAGGFPALVGSVLRTASEVGAGGHATGLDTRIDLAGKLAMVAPEVPVAVTLPVGLILVAAVALLARRLPGSRQGVAPLVVGAAVLVAVPHFAYDIALLLPVGGYAATTLFGQAWSRSDRWLLAVLAITMIICLIPGSAIHRANEAVYSAAALAVSAAAIAWTIVVLRTRAGPAIPLRS